MSDVIYPNGSISLATDSTSFNAAAVFILTGPF